MLIEGAFAKVSQDSRVIDAYFGGGANGEAAA